MYRRSETNVDDNLSVWRATAARSTPAPHLRGETTADVVVVGGGFTGLSTAWHLVQRFPERRIVVLEARTVGTGASGRNAGMALHWIDGPDLADPERALRHHAVTTEAMGWIEGWIRDHAPQVSFRREGCLELVTSERRADAARHEAEVLASFGLPVRFLEGPELASRLRVEGAVGALLDPTAGVLHGLDFVQALRDAVVARGVEVYERSPVVAVEEGRTHVVSTPEGRVRAPTLVLATNAYTPSLGWFGTGVLPLHSHVVATEPLSRERWRELGWGEIAAFSDDLDRIAYASLTPDGRLLFGGGGNRAYDYYWGGRTAPPAPPDRGHAFVREVMLRYFPALADVRIEHRWSGTLGITLSRVCSMGVTGPHHNVLYALGYSGHGVVLANLAGRVLCDLYSDHPEPWRDLPFFQRRLGGVPPEPLRKVGYEVYTRLTGRSPRR